MLSRSTVEKAAIKFASRGENEAVLGLIPHVRSQEVANELFDIVVEAGNWDLAKTLLDSFGIEEKTGGLPECNEKMNEAHLEEKTGGSQARASNDVNHEVVEEYEPSEATIKRIEITPFKSTTRCSNIGPLYEFIKEEDSYLRRVTQLSSGCIRTALPKSFRESIPNAINVLRYSPKPQPDSMHSHGKYLIIVRYLEEKVENIPERLNGCTFIGLDPPCRTGRVIIVLESSKLVDLTGMRYSRLRQRKIPIVVPPNGLMPYASWFAQRVIEEELDDLIVDLYENPSELSYD